MEENIYSRPAFPNFIDYFTALVHNYGEMSSSQLTFHDSIDYFSAKKQISERWLFSQLSF